jgi:hypothetical protein
VVDEKDDIDDVDGATAEKVLYAERLRPPLWWYLAGLAISSLLAGEFHISGIRLTDWLSFGILLPLSVIIVWSFGRSTLTVTTSELRIDAAHIPLRFISGSVGLDAKTLRLVLGREGDPQAFLRTRPFIGPGVQFWLDDPEDPTPYWVLSSRHPERIVQIMRSLGK